ncbi:MAG: hypothetical protein LBQ84_04805, partial [Flavobacteriaceae bacterium]|nr:hypothetical protein [Flavobacteriaceae bacterium]
GSNTMASPAWDDTYLILCDSQRVRRPFWTASTSLAFQAKSGVGTLRRSLTCGYEDSALRDFKKSFRVSHSQSQERGCSLFGQPLVLIPNSG